MNSFPEQTGYINKQLFSFWEADIIVMSNQVHASHILVKSETEAKKIIERIESGEDFTIIARECSVCPSGQNGGDLGWFERGCMVPDFEKACFDGKAGTIVGPIQTRFGWHVIHIIETK
ncbi:peptidylprolyl isomerase [Methanovulcanius yangii]|uniref:peptidylprolyl isomerase n=1 Tax=Methanovulcanius yangii TaxID=1789227 RepID=UPI0029C9CAA8|nr:peptidylprolyl isomerase [Methanovulcanius yangii]